MFDKPWVVHVEYEDDTAEYGPFPGEAEAQEWIDTLSEGAYNQAWASRLWSPVDDHQRLFWEFERNLRNDAETDNDGQIVIHTGLILRELGDMR